MDRHCQQEAKKSNTPAGFSPLLCKLRPRPCSSEHCPPLIQGGESEMGSHIVTGFLYEIDHLHLPTGAPSQLRSVRVAMVCEMSNCNIGVWFPSMASLREFFNFGERRTHPALDEKFVMGKALAARVLVKIVPVDIYAQQKRLESFWLISSVAAGMCRGNGTDEEKRGPCYSMLNENGMVTWGSTRQMKFLGRHKENEFSHGNAHNSSSNFLYGVAGLWGDKSEERDSKEGIYVVGDDSREGDQEGEDKQIDSFSADDQEIDEEEEANNLKRKRCPFRNNGGVKKTKVEIRAVKKETVEQNGRKKIVKGRMRCEEAEIQRDSKFRWSAERYKLAEKNLLGLMKFIGATAEKPIPRPQLRDEARKKIPNTGLLDNLLKHMVGRLAPGGKERFRRKHNPDGVMEYWLEKADLVDIRKDTGVEDPYWVPPPGWKPGDSPNQDHLFCATELKLLKDEFCKMKSEMGLMATKMQLEKEAWKLRRKLEEINSKSDAVTSIDLNDDSIES